MQPAIPKYFSEGATSDAVLLYNVYLEGSLLRAALVAVEDYCVQRKVPYTLAALSLFHVRVRPLKGTILVYVDPKDALLSTYHYPKRFHYGVRYMIDAERFTVRARIVAA